MNPQTFDQQSEEPVDLTALWRHCVAGDADWASLIERVDPLLRRTLVALGQSYGVYVSRDLLDEMMQETYVRLLQNDRRVLRGCRGRSETTIRSYLRRVARSTLVDWMRNSRALKRGAYAELSIEALTGRAGDAQGFDVPSRASSPLDVIYVQELRRRFRRECRCVARHDETAGRDTFITERILVDGWNSRELARAVQLAPSTVATVFGRMRRELRRRGLLVPTRLRPSS